jgi:ATP-binding protein involved in chromosome partitioning
MPTLRKPRLRDNRWKRNLASKHKRNPKTVTDPRTSIINERLKPVHRIIAVSSGKGGVGKSLVATTLALTLKGKGCKVGLLDIDFTSPTTHIILGVTSQQPKEDKGLIPPTVHGLEYMSLVYYTTDRAAPLRGEDTSNVLIELLAVTRWSKLDYLVIDMPPGIGDAVLDLIRLIKNVEFLIVTTPSRLAFETVRKLTSLLHELKVPVIGIVENMKMNEQNSIKPQTQKLGLSYLAEIPFDPTVEAGIGNPAMLLKTTIAKQMKIVAQRNLRP